MTWLRVGLLYGSTSNITATKSEIRQRLVKSMHFKRKKSQSQNSIQHFEFSRIFLALVGLPFSPLGRYCLTASALKKCGKIQNVVSSFDFEIFSPEMHALVLL